MNKSELLKIKKELISEIKELCSKLQEPLYNTDSIAYVNWVKYIEPTGQLSVRGESIGCLSPFDIYDVPIEGLFDILKILKKNS